MLSSVASVRTPAVNFSTASDSRCRMRFSSAEVVKCFRDANPPSPRVKLQRLVNEFKAREEPIERVKLLLDYSTRLPPMPESSKVPANRVRGCTAEVWLAARVDESGRMRFEADSDSVMARGFCGCLVWAMDGAAAAEVAAVRAEDLAEVSVGSVGGGVDSRVNTWTNVLFAMQKKSREVTVEKSDSRP
uniref:Fe-S metabolism associated domain-containing protein n=1 Tax=Kalanchoe fedtschenkoi TaxID=63787 RepID=A0A7N0V157_KALFE